MPTKQIDFSETDFGKVYIAKKLSFFSFFFPIDCTGALQLELSIWKVFLSMSSVSAGLFPSVLTFKINNVGERIHISRAKFFGMVEIFL